LTNRRLDESRPRNGLRIGGVYDLELQSRISNYQSTEALYDVGSNGLVAEEYFLALDAGDLLIAQHPAVGVAS
jgi:hypothetical protein